MLQWISIGESFAADCTTSAGIIVNGRRGTIGRTQKIFVSYIPLIVGVAFGTHNHLCHKNGVTSGAMLTFSQAAGCAGGGDGRINDLSMAFGFYNDLWYQNGIAGGAILTLGQTCADTACRITSVYYDGVVFYLPVENTLLPISPQVQE